MLARSSSVQRATEDALADRRQAEHVVGDVVVPVLNAGTAGAPAVHRHVLLLCRNAKRMEVEAAEAAKLAWLQAPRHAVVGEVGQWMAQRRELPVEHGENARLGGMKDQVVEAI